MRPRGKVFLVGAGPGDPELMTVKAVQTLAAAEVVVYDRLVSPAILALAPAGAARVDVGKQPGRHSVPQAEINALLVRLAARNRTVVRLKGGDPYIFGRGSEEALELARHGIAFEVVPGVTAAQGAAAAAGVPLTHRGLATSVRYITGHRGDDASLDFDWPGLADPATTVVVYMGLQEIGGIAQRLIAAGRAAATPVAAVEKATLAGQRRLVTRLDRVAAEVAAAGFTGPAVFVIGEVARLSAALAGDQEDDDGADRARAAG